MPVEINNYYLSDLLNDNLSHLKLVLDYFHRANLLLISF